MLGAVSALRSVLKRESLNAFIIPTDDAHGSEYISESDKRRVFISGFTGSAGTAVVTHDKAALWTDGRYFLQASQQLDPSIWTLMKQGLPGVLGIEDWLNSTLPPNSNVGVDAKLLSQSTAVRYRKALQEKGHSLKIVKSNPVDEVWSNRPAAPSAPIFVHPIKYSGQDHKEKIAAVREHLKSVKADALVVSALDEVAWLYNLRGSDIPFNPVFLSYAVVTLDKAYLFIDAHKITAEVRAHLADSVEVKDYTAVFDFVAGFQDKTVSMDSAKVNLQLFSSLPESRILVETSPITLPKAIKNPVELEGMRQAHIRDAAAMAEFFAWLEAELQKTPTPALDEYSVSEVLAEYRSKQKDFVSLSFETIAGVGPNGAIIHYKPEKATAAKIDPKKLFLLDSGGQYRDGTTDITRTVHFGEPSAREKECFTRVLQGHIALDTVVFPHGVNGIKLDPLARLSLWSSGLDYRHGTGHGVGAFLNVHEGPQGIGSRESAATVIVPGMTVTDEPGYYEDGQFGIRIENVLITKEAKTPNNFGGTKFYSFEHITVVPMQTKLMDLNLLSEKEVEWVNKYNQECFDKVSPLVHGPALDWLKRETKPIKKHHHHHGGEHHHHH